MKKPRYYCESCGREVRADAKVCPHCGRFFAAVKCPKCGASGRVEEFRAGCPVCGYAEGMNPPPEPIKPPPPLPTALSPWAYALGVLAFLVVAALLVRASR